MAVRSRRRMNPALIAALAFIAIQVGLGVIFKIAQRGDGKYAFSQSSSLVISEFCKLLLSTGFFYRQYRQRQNEAALVDPEKSGYTTVISGKHAEDTHRVPDKFRRSFESTSVSSSHDDGEVSLDEGARSLPPHGFLEMVVTEISSPTAYGMTHLALLYAIINNSVFLLYRMADPGTISLIRSGITLITALTLIVSTGQNIASRQWLAILFQICGVVVTQYRPDTGALYPLWTYVLLIFQTTVSATAGVYNQSLLKSEEGSLHVCNMALYAAGSLINMVIHLITRVIDPSEPSFLVGYGSWSALMVIMSNVFIGLAITAVYKYSDALVKCFATAVSTGILLYIAPIIFRVPLSFLVIPGTVTVFAATWLYVTSPPEKKEKPGPTKWKLASVDSRRDGPSLQCWDGTANALSQFGPHGSRVKAGVGFAMTFTVLLILALAKTKVHDEGGGPDQGRLVLKSPLRNSLAFIRLSRKDKPELKENLMGYKPFFNQLHFSMPGYIRPVGEQQCHETTPGCGKRQFNNITADNYDDDLLVYESVATTMQHILDLPVHGTEEPIQSLTYFQSDTWIDPLGFSTDDTTKIWFPDSSSTRFECMNSKTNYRSDWWGWSSGRSTSGGALVAVREITEHLKAVARTRVKHNEFCIGNTNIFHIPRAYFNDFIQLSKYFLDEGVLHQIAIPTMIHIIDLSRRGHERQSDSIITHLSDCYDESHRPSATDMTWHRCGYKLPLQIEDSASVFFAKLHASATALGSPVHSRVEEQDIITQEVRFDLEDEEEEE